MSDETRSRSRGRLAPVTDLATAAGGDWSYTDCRDQLRCSERGWAALAGAGAVRSPRGGQGPAVGMGSGTARRHVAPGCDPVRRRSRPLGVACCMGGCSARGDDRQSEGDEVPGQRRRRQRGQLRHGRRPLLAGAQPCCPLPPPPCRSAITSQASKTMKSHLFVVGQGGQRLAHAQGT